MDATVILIDSDAELSLARSLIDFGTRMIRPISHGWRRRRA
jgi:hypothetical protein